MASKKKAAKKTQRGASTDAIALLKQDHATVKALFEKFESARTPQKIKLAQQICQELTAHTTIEEELFYPAARDAVKDDDMFDEANVEHQSAKELISQIESGSPGQDMWEAKVKVLGEYINHHVQEEEGEMFPQVKKSGLDLKQLGLQLQERKQQLLAE